MSLGKAHFALAFSFSKLWGIVASHLLLFSKCQGNCLILNKFYASMWALFSSLAVEESWNYIVVGAAVGSWASGIWWVYVVHVISTGRCHTQMYTSPRYSRPKAGLWVRKLIGFSLLQCFLACYYHQVAICLLQTELRHWWPLQTGNCIARKKSPTKSLMH